MLLLSGQSIGSFKLHCRLGDLIVQSGSQNWLNIVTNFFAGHTFGIYTLTVCLAVLLELNFNH